MTYRNITGMFCNTSRSYRKSVPWSQLHLYHHLSSLLLLLSSTVLPLHITMPYCYINFNVFFFVSLFLYCFDRTGQDDSILIDLWLGKKSKTQTAEVICIFLSRKKEIDILGNIIAIFKHGSEDSLKHGIEGKRHSYLN